MTGPSVTRRLAISAVIGSMGSAALGGCSDDGAEPNTVNSSDRVVVYGATPAGIAAAIAARETGSKVLLLHGEESLGGMMANGISHSDVMRPALLGGFPQELFARVGGKYGHSRPVFDFEPHVAEAVFNDWLKAAGVEHRAGILRDVDVRDKRIRNLGLSNGEIVNGATFVDASYQGRLVVGSGVTCAVGREGQEDYGESLAGFGHNLTEVQLPGSPPTARLPGVAAPPGDRTIGSGDGLLQAFSYRACLSGDPSNMVAFDRPTGYNRSAYELLARYLNMGHKLSLTRSQLPNRKYDLNGGNVVDTDFIGGNRGFAHQAPEDRLIVARDHEVYVRGMLYFLIADKAVPHSVRKGMSAYGLAADEFTDNDNWPRQLYIRELWRMRGQYVMRQSDVQNGTRQPDSVAIGYYPMDCHPVQRFRGTSADEFVVEGPLPHSHTVQPYEIPLRAILPKREEIANLIVPVSLSCTHVAWTSLRIEATLMSLGEAAGVLAAHAVRAGGTTEGVSVATVQHQLTSRKAKFTL